MRYPRAPSSPTTPTTRHHTKEQTMHYSSSSSTALSPARPERLRDHKAGHRRDNDVPLHLVARDITNAAYEDVIGRRTATHRRPVPPRTGCPHCCAATLAEQCPICRKAVA